jgi:hypothetical protein
MGDDDFIRVLFGRQVIVGIRIICVYSISFVYSSTLGDIAV